MEKLDNSVGRIIWVNGSQLVKTFYCFLILKNGYEQSIQCHTNLECIIEKHVSSEIKTIYRISKVFTQLGWAPMLLLPTHYYLDMVSEFYANIFSKACHSAELVDSWVCGTWMYLTRDLIACIFGCNNTGLVVDLKKGFVAPNKR